mmetsp:Transcript_18953/g.41009  ORF Transcript_18953/g.41009 Transcript_18953/m.41009 type:complete len:295 (+) Transcript_18953:298-1182(+)
MKPYLLRLVLTCITSVMMFPVASTAFFFPSGMATTPSTCSSMLSPSSTPLVKNVASPALLLIKTTTLALRGGEITRVVDGAFEWCTNLIGPAALVAGAVIGTIYENMNTGDLELLATDRKKDRLGKKITRTLLFSAFVLEVVAIFVMAVTMTMLCSRSPDTMTSKAITATTTPLMFMRDSFEFEYLTIRICFLQGLFNWLGAIALSFAIPSGESPETRKMNNFVAASVLTVLCLIIAFYDNHLTFYDNYFAMVWRWMSVAWPRFFWRWPPRRLAYVYIPSALTSVYYGIIAFWP